MEALVTRYHKFFKTVIEKSLLTACSHQKITAAFFQSLLNALQKLSFSHISKLSDAVSLLYR